MSISSALLPLMYSTVASRIFGDIAAGAGKENEYSVLGATHVTMASRMKAQIAAAATLSNITNSS